MHEARSAAGETSFVRELVRRLRAVDDGDAWSGRSDGEVLAPLLGRGHHRDRDGELDPDVYLRIELFFDAVAAVVEARSGIACATILRMHQEGHGRVLLVAGRLVVVSHARRDAERFGFDSIDALARAGERIAGAALDLIARHADVAHLPP